MSYQVIARKWRPKSFTELVGQDHVAQTLLNALKSDRLPHAVLFTGPRGTGKTSSARILAKCLRCPNAVDYIPCNECRECQDISQGRSFDVHELDGASNNGVDAIRELQEGVRSMPASGKYKLYIIDEVHMLSISAFNALLKTLEEPPSHVIFVLATTEVQKIPNTILSRCQRFDFRRISIRQVAEHLKHICESDGVDADEESLWMIARQGGGSMRDSQSLLDQVITYTSGQLQSEKVIDVLGLTDRTLLLDTTKALAKRDPEGVLNVIERIFQTGHDAKVFVEDLLEELRHLLLVKINPDNAGQVIDLPESEIESLSELGIDLSEEDIHMLFDMALKGAGDLVRAHDPRLVLEMLLLRMAAAPKVQSLAQLLSGGAATNTGAPKKKVGNPSAAQRPAGQTPANRQPVQNQQAQAHQPQTPQNRSMQNSANQAGGHNQATNSQRSQQQPQKQTVHATAQPAKREIKAVAFDASKKPEENWFQFVRSLKLNDALMAAQLENTHVVAMEDNNLQIGLAENLKFLYDQVASPEFIDKLKAALKKAWQKELQIEVKLGKKPATSLSPQESAEKKAKEEKEKTWQAVESHPLVKSTQEKLNAKIDAIKESK